MLPGIKSRLVASHLAVAIVAAAAVSVVLSVAFTRLQVEYYKHALLASALALADALETDFGTPHGQVQARHALRKLAANRPWGLAVVNATGTVSGSTDASLPEGLCLATPAEVAAATRSVLLIPNATGGEPYAVAVAPVEKSKRTIGMVRAWVTRQEFDASVAPLKRTLTLALGAVCALSVLLSLILAQALISPIRRMRQLSQRVARGDFAIRIGRTTDDELGALASDLDAMASRLQDLESLRRDFVGNVSHELRSPVSNIRVTSEVLQRRASQWGADSEHLFQTIVLETERLETLIAELMELSAIESGALQLQIEVVEAKPFFGELIESVSALADHRGIRLAVQAEPGLVIRADRVRLERALRNLLDNAIKFTPAGGQVTLSARTAGREVEIEVADTGEGIATADLPRIFERFYRTDKARQRKGGAGIGLAIVKHIVEAHGGTVRVSSEEGRGSKFCLRLSRD